MPQVSQFIRITSTHITPINCAHCAGAAHMTGRFDAITGDGRGEIRIFECSDCDELTEMFVRD